MLDDGHMLRLRWVILIWLAGLLVLAYGIAVEMGVRAEIGSGARRFAAHLVYHGEIEQYRQMARTCVLIGPGVLVLGLVLLRKQPRQSLEQQDPGS